MDTNTVRPTFNNFKSIENVPEKKLSIWDRLMIMASFKGNGGSNLRHARPSKGSTKAHRKIKRQMTRESRRKNRS